MRAAVVVTGGDPVPLEVLQDLPESPWVVAADSGADHAVTLGLAVDVIVGDMDSIAPATRAALPNAEVRGHSPDKDATDLELAMALVAERQDIARLVLVGGTGGRIDHFLANATLISSPRFAHLQIEWIAHPARVTVVHDHARLHGTDGDGVSLIPMGGMAEGVRTTGLRWPLVDEILPFGSSRGVSNEFTSAVATVSITSGVLLAVQPNG